MSKNTIFIINGLAGSGKDSFATIYSKYSNKESIIYSSVEKVKEAALYFGWDGIKTPAGRHFLMKLKQLSVWYNNGPINSIMERIGTTENVNVFLQVREKEEMERLKEYFHNATALLVERPDYIAENFASPDILSEVKPNFTLGCMTLGYHETNDKSEEFISKLTKLICEYEDGYFEEVVAGNNGVKECNYDTVILNNGTYEEFESKIENLVKFLEN